MKKIAVGLALLCSLAWVGSQAADRTWITDVTIISPENLDRIVKGSVLIEDGRIVSVERNRAAKSPAGAKVVSGKGQFLVPGLIDSHVHLAMVPGMIPNQASGKEGLIEEYFRQLPRSYLYYGYTTLVDLAVIDPTILEDFRKAPLHPDVFDCGPPVVFANGYPMSFTPPELRFKKFPNFVYDANQSSSIPAEYKPEDHTPAACVARVKESGAICVKTFFEHGFARDKNLPVMSPEVLAEIHKSAAQAGLVLLVHANSFEAQQFAIDGNADVLVHGMWHWGKRDNEAGLPTEIRKLLDVVVERGIGYQPTIQVLAGERVYFDSGYLKGKAIPKVVPANLLAWFNTTEGKWFKEEIGAGDVTDAVMRESFDQGPIRRDRQVAGYLARKDANFLFGTDTPSGPTYGNLPGLNGYLEMKQLEAAGLSLAQIFKAATINNARQFRIDAQVGTIEPGKVANLVLMNQSPLMSVEAYDSITAVWIHGTRIPRDELAADKKVIRP
jgi:imidazolonepropionase-like amidohydrolase